MSCDILLMITSALLAGAAIPVSAWIVAKLGWVEPFTLKLRFGPNRSLEQLKEDNDKDRDEWIRIGIENGWAG